MDNNEQGVQKLATGINGLDAILEGGIPEARVITVVGSAGAGKTVLLNEFLYRGITKYDQNGVFVSFEEIPEDIIRNVAGFAWDYRALIREGKLSFVDLSPQLESTVEVSEDYDLSPIILRIRRAVEKVNAKRVVIDSLASLFTRLENEREIRSFIYRLCRNLKDMGVSTLISSEFPDLSGDRMGSNVQEYVSDGVIQLRLLPGEQKLMRTILVSKMRGVAYRSGYVQFEIGPEGLEVFPKIAVKKNTAQTDFSARRKTGILGLDEALDGGIPQGHIVLMSGNTGSGKTLSCLQFIETGLRRGEKAVYVALEEPLTQILKTALEHGWDLEAREKKGVLRFVTGVLIDLQPDRILSDIVRAVEEMDAKRVVIDSISSIMSASMNSESVRQFLLQLANYLKSKGITAMLSYLMAANFGAVKGQLLSGLETNSMRLSSVVDGIVLMQYVQRQQRVEKLLTVLKMRGGNHSRDIFKYEIERGGLVLGSKFDSRD